MRRKWKKDGSEVSVVYLDANVFIFAEISSEKEGELARQILFKLDEGKFKAITSVLTIDEVIWALRKEIDYSHAIAVGKKMFNISNLDIVGVDTRIMSIALDYMEKDRLMPRDAIHAASMVSNKVRRIASEDPDFKKIRKIEALTFSEFLKKMK